MACVRAKTSHLLPDALLQIFSCWQKAKQEREGLKRATGSVQLAAVSPDLISQTFSIPIGKPSREG